MNPRNICIIAALVIVSGGAAYAAKPADVPPAIAFESKAVVETNVTRGGSLTLFSESRAPQQYGISTVWVQPGTDAASPRQEVNQQSAAPTMGHREVRFVEKGQYSRAQIGLGRDGLPVVVVAKDSTVLLVHCDDPDCVKTSKRVIARGIDVPSLSVLLDGTAPPVFSFRTNGGAREIVQCRDERCFASTCSTVNDTRFDWGGFVSANDGLLVYGTIRRAGTHALLRLVCHSNTCTADLGNAVGLPAGDLAEIIRDGSRVVAVLVDRARHVVRIMSCGSGCMCSASPSFKQSCAVQGRARQCRAAGRAPIICSTANVIGPRSGGR